METDEKVRCEICGKLISKEEAELGRDDNIICAACRKKLRIEAMERTFDEPLTTRYRH
jgi:formylmethanofuran dehydrogenase subunit E